MRGAGRRRGSSSSCHPTRRWTTGRPSSAFAVSGRARERRRTQRRPSPVTSERYPASKPRILAKGAEAMVVFVAAPPNDDLVEFNVFKYGGGPAAAGAWRFRIAA